MHSEMFFQVETGTHSPFKGESFYGCTSCPFSMSLMEKCQKFPTEKIFHEEKQNVKEAVGEVSQQEPPLPLRQY